MIVILPTTTGYVIGTVPLRTTQAKKKALSGRAHVLSHKKTLGEHLARIRKWMRLSKRYAN
jgi:hypothetical protein